MENNLRNQLRLEVQARFLKLFNWILVLSVFGVGFMNIGSSSPIVPAMFAGGFLLLANAIFYSIRPNYTFSSVVLFCVFCSMLVFSYYTGGIDGLGIMWLLTASVLSYFLFGKKIGTWILSLFLGWMVLFYLLANNFDGQSVYTWWQTQQALTACLLIGVVMYFYEAFYDSQQRELERYSSDIENVAYQIKAEDMKERELLEVTQRQKEELEASRTAMLNLLEDVSLQQKNSEALARDLQKFKQAVDAVSDHIVITDPEGMVVYANAAAVKITGYTSQEVMGKKAGIMWKLPMPQEYYEKLWYTIKTEKRPFISEITNRRKSGEEYVAEIKIYPVLDVDAGIVFFVGLERDITEQKKHYELVERLASIVENTEDAIIGEDLNWKITSWNKGAENLYGYTAEEAVGQPISLIVPEDRQNEKILAFQKVVGEGRSMHIQTQRKRKDGKLIDVDINYSPITSTDGQLSGFSIIARDITKEKQVDRAKTEFVALASHQLKTPLAAVNWYSEMLMEGDAGKLNKEQMKYMTEIREGSKRMTDLVNALLNVSRLDMGNFAVEPKDVDLAALAKSVAGDLESQMKAKKIAFKQSIQKGLKEFYADPNLMRMILQNLLSNAVKYSKEKGKVEMEIGYAKKASLFGGKKLAQDSLAVAVSDSGIGIPKEQQKKIFQKMFRAQNAQNSSVEGNGLGLYIIRMILEQSGGQVWFESAENKGASFYVTLPKSGMVKKAGEKKLS